jgi:4-hydroxybenzoate polyprenyltransferase
MNSMLWWTLALAVCVFTGLYARNKGRRFCVWALLSIIVTPFVASALLFIRKDLRTPEQRAIASRPRNGHLLIASILCLAGMLYLADHDSSFDGAVDAHFHFNTGSTKESGSDKSNL